MGILPPRRGVGPLGWDRSWALCKHEGLGVLPGLQQEEEMLLQRKGCGVEVSVLLPFKF